MASPKREPAFPAFEVLAQGIARIASTNFAVEPGPRQRRVKVVKELGELGIGDGVASPAFGTDPRLCKFVGRQLYVGDIGHQVPSTRELRLRIGAPLSAILLIILVELLSLRVKNTVCSSVIDQATDYALDLKNFQAGSHDLPIVPIMTATNAAAIHPQVRWSPDEVATAVQSSGDAIGRLIRCAGAARSKKPGRAGKE